jgi:hypothetical protein
MTYEEAVEQLSFHCGANPDIENPRWKNGFLQTLRPFGGLRNDVYDDLCACVDAVGPHLRSSAQLNRDVVASLWAVLHYADAWAIQPDGMLRRNDLISEEDLATIRGWILGLREQIARWLDEGEQAE